ncbi:MAG: YidC/Oxa1 family membrane protein insertase [bacterium]|nr:YidC/Oxa1 family membrane protein insertase [bacterium]
MILSALKAIFYQPLYNALVFLAVNLPTKDLGVAIILLTIIVRLLLYPLYHKSLTTQKKMKDIEPELTKIKEIHKDNKEEQTKKILTLYKDHGVNPLTSFVVVLIQLPIILSLFYVFRGSIQINPDLLYSFIPPPEAIQHLFLGFLDITKRSIPLAVLVGLTQFFQMKLAVPPLPPKTNDSTPSFKDDLSRSMNMQMRYVMPIMIVFVSIALPAALSLYWLTSNLFSIVHELIVKRKALELKSVR